ncbi:MAG: hypothetical protein AMXMBFR61_03710 [Fimbriimonadales bacterium]
MIPCQIESSLVAVPSPPRILVHGTFCLDRVLRVPRLPVGGYVEITEETWGLGGEAANTVASLVKWGAPVRFVPNPIGTDPDSERLLQLAEQAGLPLDYATREPDATVPVCQIYVTPDGERTMFGQGFSNLAEGELQPFDCSGCGWFTTDSNFGALGAKALAHARKCGLYTVAMDYTHKDDPPLADLHLTSRDWLQEPPSEWARRTSQTVLLTKGMEGCELHGPEGCRVFPAYPARRVIDTTGAGDCFRAGLLYGLQQGQSLCAAIRFASAAASLSVAELGACGGIPTLDQVLRVIEEYEEVSARFDQA